MSIYALSGKFFWSKVCQCKKFDKFHVGAYDHVIINLFNDPQHSEYLFLFICLLIHTCINHRFSLKEYFSSFCFPGFSYFYISLHPRWQFVFLRGGKSCCFRLQCPLPLFAAIKREIVGSLFKFHHISQSRRSATIWFDDSKQL